MFADEQDIIGRRYIKALATHGYDYVELPLAQVMELDKKDFNELLFELVKYKIPCECCNNFFPKEIRLTGPDICMVKIEKYIQKSMQCAVNLGAKIIVFGSSAAKNIPNGFPYHKAFLQLIEILKIIDYYAIENNLIVVIEPLNHLESNLIINLTEGKELLHTADFKNIKLLVDYYHFMLEKDNYEVLKDSMPNLFHAHFAQPEGRVFPTELKADYKVFLETLYENHYQGRLSVEAFSNNPHKDMKKFISLLS